MTTSLLFTLVLGCADSSSTSYTNDFIPIASDQTTRLDFSSKPGTDGKVDQLEALGNMAMRWNGDGTLTWGIDVATAGEYQIGFSYASIEEGGDISVYTDSHQVDETLPKSNSIFEDEYLSGLTNLNNEYLINYDRYVFPEPLNLEEGTQEFHVTISDIGFRKVIDFRAIELTPVSQLSEIQETDTLATSMRANAEWMNDALYGVMYHWTDLTVNPDGSQLEYKQAVDEFDVQAFGELNETIGSGYVLFTLNHQYPHCPAPIEAWETIHPGWTTERDLIQEIADDLGSRGIPLLLYVASHLVGNQDNPQGNRIFNSEVKWLKAHQFGQQSDIANEDHFDIFNNNVTVLSAIGERYGDKVAGFWLDGWDLIPEVYPHSNFQELFEASKVGNADRIVTFNRWIFPTVTPWQDYWAGEIDSPDKLPTAQYMDTEVGKGLFYHSLIAMEDDWAFTAEGLEESESFYNPRYSSEDLVEYIQGIHSVGGAVTINIVVHQNGTLGTEAMQIMTEVKDALR